MDIKGIKKAIRKEIKARKESAGPEKMTSLSLAIQEQVLSLEELSKSKTILLYHSLPDEVGTSLLLEKLSSRASGDKRVVLPVVEGEYLLLKEYLPNNMEKGYRDIYEPAGEDCIDPSEIDLAIIPGVAFDCNCNRLGRGKGYYDRLIPFLNCRKIGLSFDFQITEGIPCEEFDMPLDMVITETAIYRSPEKLR